MSVGHRIVQAMLVLRIACDLSLLALCGLLPCPVTKSPRIAWPFSVVCATAVGQDFNAVFELRSAVRTVIYSKLSRS